MVPHIYSILSGNYFSSKINRNVVVEITRYFDEQYLVLHPKGQRGLWRKVKEGKAVKWKTKVLSVN